MIVQQVRSLFFSYVFFSDIKHEYKSLINGSSASYTLKRKCKTSPS